MKVLWVGKRPAEWPGADVRQLAAQDFDPALCLGADAVIVEFSAASAGALSILRAIRQQPTPAIYLSPVFFVTDGDVDSQDVRLGSADGAAFRSEFSAAWHQDLGQRAQAIRGRIGRLAELQRPVDTNLAFKALRLVFSRGGAIAPQPTASHRRGYIFPLLEPLVSQEDATVGQLLDFLEGQGLMAAEMVDRVYQCSACQSSFLNVREVCSHCRSPLLVADDLIHHFRCGYVAPLQEFRAGDELACPKCERKLRQVGVDYDKPSSVYRCRACGHASQDTGTLATCFHCRRSAEPEEQTVWNVCRYRQTALAENAAVFGMESLFRQVVESELEVLPVAVFKHLVRLENERIKRYRMSNSSLVLMRLDGLERVYLERGSGAKALFDELVSVLKSVLRNTDILTGLNETLFLILLLETPREGAERAIARIHEQMAALLTSNLGTGMSVALQTIALDGERGPDAVIDELIQRTG